MKKLLACILALTFMTLTLAACSGTTGGDTGTNTGTSGADAGTSADTNTISSYDQLMNMEDVLPLSGIQPKQLKSRADVDKALPIEQKDDVVIGWTSSNLGSSFFTGMMDSAKKACDKYGYTLYEQNANYDLQTQSTQIDAFITQSVDVIVLNAVDLHSSVADIGRAVDAGIPVLVTGPTAANDNYQMISTFLSGSNESGFQVGLYTAEKLYNPDEVLNVGIAIAKMPDADSNSRPCGFISGYLYQKAEMDGNPYESKYDALLDGYYAWTELKAKGSLDMSDKNLNFVAVGVGENIDAAAGQKASSDMITAHPDMDLILIETDSMTAGVIQELRQHNLEPGENVTLVTCADGSRQALDYIKSGELLTTATNIPYYCGEGIVELIHKIYAEGFDANDMPANSFTPTIAITPENVDKYYDESLDFAKYDSWTPLTTNEYNELHAND